MADNQIDHTVLSLVFEFFRSQFELRNAQFPLNSDDYLVDADLLQSSEYRRISTLLLAKGRLYIEEFQERIDNQIQAFLPSLEPPNGAAAFAALSNHFFAEGVDWNLVLTYFVFSAELALHANQQRLASVDNVAQWLVQYITEHLQPWINDNGGWNGIETFFNENANDQRNDLRELRNIYGVGAAALGFLSLGFFLTRS